VSGITPAPEVLLELARLGSATVYEAAGREGLIDLPLQPLIAGSRVAGPALPVMCGQDDNLMIHAAVEQALPGEVVVVTMPQPAPVGVLGELLATQFQVRGVAALLIDAAVRDVEELIRMGLPIWTRHVRIRGATKDVVGTVGEPVSVGGARIARGDVVVLDADGAVAVPRERVDEVLEASLARERRETTMRQRLASGETSLDIHGLRAKLGA
jgi:4-hydroxy-4-methyl-2-oxoglutarate aldolase